MLSRCDFTPTTSFASARASFSERKVMRLELYFPEPRRGSDLLLIALNGPKEKVLRLPNYLFDTFSQIDIELVRSEEDDGVYRILIAVTKKLEQQRPKALENRKKLRRRVWNTQMLEQTRPKEV